MNILKKSFKITFALLLFASALVAQKSSCQLLMKPLSDELKSNLSLSAEQVQQIENVQAQHRDQLIALHHNNNLARSAKREQHQDMLANAQKDIRNILSAEQAKQLQALRKQKREERKKQMEGVDRKAMNAELKAYREKEIEPVMKGYKEKLAMSLTADEKATLAVIAAKIEAQRAVKKEERQAKKADRAAMGEDAPKQRMAKDKEQRASCFKAKGKAARLTRMLDDADYETVKAMTDKYDHLFAPMEQAIEQRSAQWKADQDAIRARYISTSKPDRVAPDAELENIRKAVKKEQQRIALLIGAAK